MKNIFLVAMITSVAVTSLSGCSPMTITFGAAPSPVVIIVTATPAPTQPPPPTLTPLPVLPSATPTSVPTPTATPPALPTSAPSQPISPLPPPPQPQATPFLPQLSVSDQGGGNLDLFMFGGQIGGQLVFRALACAPNCNNRPDGRDVNSVSFTFFKRLADGTLKWVFEHTESGAPYCSFGGSGGCNFLDIRNTNTRWPGTQNVIENGDYVLSVGAEGKNRAAWSGNFYFKIQR
jgi:hypothetical protein